MKKLLVLLMGVIFLSGCTDESTSKRILEENGYTEIQITGYNAFCCSDDDTYSTGFKAKSPNGTIVSGCVCTGAFKGSTIRFE